jgi:hypothetical protein
MKRLMHVKRLWHEDTQTGSVWVASKRDGNLIIVLWLLWNWLYVQKAFGQDIKII